MCALLFIQDDWESWIKFQEKVGSKVQVVGDDLTVTNIERIKTAADRKACSALLLKVNQVREGALSSKIFPAEGVFRELYRPTV